MFYHFTHKAQTLEGTYCETENYYTMYNLYITKVTIKI